MNFGQALLRALLIMAVTFIVVYGLVRFFIYVGGRESGY